MNKPEAAAAATTKTLKMYEKHGNYFNKKYYYVNN